MKIGLTGLSLTGKTTLFNLLTGSKNEGAPTGKAEAKIGIAKVPDKRISYLSTLYKPKKTTYANIEFTDIAGLITAQDGKKSGSSKFLNDVRNCDALVHVVRAFDSSDNITDEIDPGRDVETIEMELLFADLDLIEKRIEKLKSGKKITKENQIELELLEKCYHFMADEELPMREIELTEDERISLRNYAFLTEKPRLAVTNVDERQFKSKEYPGRNELMTMCQEKNIPLLEICVLLESEISELNDEDKQLFMEDLGLIETGIEVLARNVYAHLGLISFFTVGEDEVKAWTIAKGTKAKAAAGKIHSDIERGFIRAEVVKYSDLQEKGSMNKVKEMGLFRLEGKEYIVEDGDIINFRFNV